MKNISLYFELNPFKLKIHVLELGCETEILATTLNVLDLKNQRTSDEWDGGMDGKGGRETQNRRTH